MALFKIFKGNSANLEATSKTINRQEGFIYLTQDDMKFYVDIDSSDPTHVTLDNNGNVIANNQTDAEKKMRKPINASKTDLLQSWWTDPGDTNGRWNVIIPGITADNLVDGLTIRIRLSTSYNSTFNTLNVNGLGPKVVYYRYNSRLTSHVGQWAEILLTYHTATSVVSTNGNTYTLNGAAASAYVNNNVNYGTDGWILDYAYSDGNNYDRILSNYERRYVGTNGLFKNTLAMIEDNGRISSIVTTESNGTSKVANPAHFRPDRILFYNGTSQSGTNKVSGAQNLYEAIPTTSAANIINESLTTYSDLYFVGTLDENGYFVFDNTNTTSYYKVVSNSAAVPANTFVEGKYYIYVGASYSTANYLQLMPSHQLFFCQDTNGQKLTAVTPLATALINPKVNKYVATQTAGTEIGKITLDNIESTLYYGKPNAFVWTTNNNGQLILNLSMSDSASVAAPVMPAASTTQNGALTHTAQTIGGEKTFNDTVILKASQYDGDWTTGALNANNSNIYNINSLRFADAANGGQEGIMFYRDATHADTIHAAGGKLYFTPNFVLPTTGATQYEILHTGNLNPVWVGWTDGTTAGPVGKATFGGVTTTAVTLQMTAIPAATTTKSGIITTASQTVAGNKFTSGTHVGMISGGEKDQFFDFAYAADPTASTAPGASWRIGALNSGSSDTNYFVIQSGGSSTSATEWKNALRIGMNTFDIAVGGNLYSSATTNTKTLGTSSARWKAVYIGTDDSYGSTYVPIYWNAGVPKACSSPSMLVNLGSTSADTIFKASPSPGIKGTLGTANGGTGNTSYTKGRVIWAETATKLAGAPEMHINWSKGTTSTIGYEELVIGNATASGTEGNAIGRIALYSSSTKGSYITAAATSASTWPNHVLPATAGWLVTAGNGSSTGAGSAYVPVYVSTAGIATACSQPSMLVNVGSTTAANVFQASPSPGVTGTLAVGNGGTGSATHTADAILTGNAANAIQSSATYVRGSMIETGRYFHNVAEFYCNNTPKEILIKTKIPFTNGNEMPKIFIHMYNYSGSIPAEITIGFYVYNGAFCNYGATSDSEVRPIITLSTYTENNQKYVAIGLGLIGTKDFPNSYYTRFNIDALDLWQNRTAKTAYWEGWTITGNTTTTTIIPTDDQKTVVYKDQSMSVVDANDGSKITLNRSGTAMTATSYVGSWDGYVLKAITPQKLRATMGLGDTTGVLPVLSGGTGVSELTAGYALIGDGTNAVKFRAIRNNTAQGALGWTAAATDTTLVTTNTIAYWNGAYSGTTSNLKYLGTVVGGTWQASTIAVAYGGTGLTSSPSMLVNLDSETADTIFKASPAPGVTGTLPVKHGGTGATSFTANRVIMSGSSTTAALTTRAVTNNTANTAIANNTNIPTMNTIYYGLAVINNASQTRGVSIYAPTTAGTQNHILVSAGGNDAPIWKNPNEITVGYANKLSPGGEISFQGDTQGAFTYIGTALTPTLTTYSVEGYKMVSKTGSPQSWYKYTMTYTTTTIPTGDWWVKIVLNRGYESWMTPVEIKADYSNRSCKLYWDLDSYNNLWRAYLTSYNSTNIKAIKRAWENSKSSLYIKLEKPTEYGGSTPQGTLTIYSPVEIVSIEQLTAEPASLQTLQYGYNSNTVISTSGWGKFATIEIAGVNTKGNSATPIYLENGVIKQCAFSFGASINASGNANRLAWYSAVNTISSGDNLYSDGSVLAVNKDNITSGYKFEVAGKTILGSTAAGNGTNTHIINGHLIVNTAKDTNTNYNSFRVNQSSEGYAGITYGGADGTTTGISDGMWWMGTYSDNLYIAHKGCNTSATTRIQGQSTGFSIYPRLAVNTNVNSSYQAYINGSLGVNGIIYGLDQTNSSSIGTGSVILSGGVSIAKAVWINSSFDAPNTETLTSAVDKSVALWDNSTLKKISTTNFIDTALPLTTIVCDGATGNKAKLKVTTAWLDTGITGADIPANGSYIVQMYVNVTGSGLSHYQEYYTGVMSWFKDGTNSSDYDEIWLHKAGHASNGNNLYLRTIRTASPNTLKLQISADVSMSAAAAFTFKFRKMI